MAQNNKQDNQLNTIYGKILHFPLKRVGDHRPC